jgi:hypothetical protein
MAAWVANGSLRARLTLAATAPAQDRPTREGDCFTAGPLPWKLAEGNADIAPAAIYPVDAIRLHGLGQYQGLSATPRMSAPGKIDGWLFPTPSQP